MPVLKVLVAGSDTADSGASIAGVLPHTRSAVLYDPATKSWSAAGGLAEARGSTTATLLSNGKVLVAGGYNSSSGDLSSAELYDAATNLWSAAGALAIARGQHTATLLPDGIVLATGGVVNSNVFVSTAERYDPATNRWSSAGTLAAGRYVHTATLLPDQTVLVAGGVGVTIGLRSSERYSRNLDFNNARRPVASATASVAPSSSLVLAGKLFSGLSEALGGNASQNSPSNFPIALLQPQGNEQQRFLGSNPLVNWTSTQLTTGAVTGFPAGPAGARCLSTASRASRSH